ncbi:MAG: glycosyltransferase [Candidatus Hydrogenedens sp.]|nr:glycosyltransferase [Candidatus Hydrogenedens sp.]
MSDARPIRVLHLTDHLNLGGVQTFLLNLIAAWQDDRFVLEVAALHGPGKHHGAFVSAGIAPVYAKHSKYDPALPFRLARLLRQSSPDIIHASGVPACLLVERLRGVCPGAKLITHLQSSYRQHDSQPYQNLLEAFCHRRSDHVIACSHAVLEGFHRRAPVSVIPNGIATLNISEAEAAAARSRQRGAAGFGLGDLVIGSVGRLVSGKDPLTLARAFAAVKKTIPNARLLWVGDGPLRGSFLAELDKQGLEGDCHITGFVPSTEVGGWLRAMDVFAFPSLREGMPLSLIESMHAGMPCIAADFPAASEVISHGKNGILVPRQEADALAAAIAALAQDESKRATLGAAARATVEERFTSKRMVEQIADVYRGLVSVS